jgi:cell division septal protein FtsQ
MLRRAELGRMAGGGRGERASRPRARPASVVVPITRPRGGVRLDAERLVPSGRSLALAFGVLAAVVLAWFAARETPMFALRSVEIAGAPQPVSRQVRQVLEREHGTSLLALDVRALARTVEKLPTVVSVSFDRAFPHALRVDVVPERPVLVVRQGAESWLVSARGRVMGTVAQGTKADLPRLWVRRDVELVPGARLTGQPAVAVLAAAPLAAVDLPRVRTVQAGEGGVTLTLRAGLLLRLGEPASIRLKLLIAGKILPLLSPDTLYVDVSVPDRPVSGTTLNSKVEIDSSTSTTA